MAGNVTSTLTVKMLDGVSGPAGKAANALRGLDRTAKGVQGSGGLRAIGAGGLAGTGILAGAGGALAGAVSAAAIAAGARKAYTDFANYDRQITRILITAGAAASEAKKTKDSLKALAADVALPVAAVTEGLDSLVAAGRSLPDAMAFIPAVARTAQAAGAEVVDIARTADAFGASMGVAGKEAQMAFDILVKLGKEGKFELKDQARYLPSLLPLASTRGLKGLDGLAMMGAALQAIRKNSGTAEEAATALGDVLGKLDSDETINRFKKHFGVDLPKSLARAKAAGQDTFTAFLNIVREVTKGDPEKLTKIFADKEARRGIIALTEHYQEFVDLQKKAKLAGGSVAEDLTRVTRDSAAAAQRLSDAAGNFSKALGNLADAAGATTALEGIASGTNKAADNLERLIEAMKKYGAVQGFMKWSADNEKTPGTAANDAKQLADELERLDKLEDIRRRKALATREYEGAKRYADGRMDKIIELNEKDFGPNHPVVIEGKRRRAEAQERLRAAQEKYLAVLYEEMAASGAGAATRSAPGPVYNPPTGRVSGATRARPRDNLQPAMIKVPPVEDAMFGVKLDDASAAREAAVARARIQQVLDANPPVIRPRVEMPSLDSAIAGSHSDYGGRR